MSTLLWQFAIFIHAARVLDYEELLAAGIDIDLGMKPSWLSRMVKEFVAIGQDMDSLGG